MKQARLVELFDLYMGGKFIWGREDCLLSSCNVFRELTGIDLAASVRGQYSTEAQALEILDRYQGGLIGLVDSEASRAGLLRGSCIPFPDGCGQIGLGTGESGSYATIHFGGGVWVTKSARGYNFSAKAETFWDV